MQGSKRGENQQDYKQAELTWNMLEKVKEYVKEVYEGYVDHFDRTVYWIKQLRPDADEALLIAGYSHDIQRKISPQEEPKFVKGDQLRYHQEEGGRIMYEWLKKNGASEEMAAKVKELISRHEEGGTEEQNVLRDADSLSFLETKVKAMKRRLERGHDRDDMKWKIDWMYERIVSPEAKRIAKPLYEKMKEGLGL